MIMILIGGSGSGKSTFIRQNYIKDDMEFVEATAITQTENFNPIIPYHYNDKSIVIGDYRDPVKPIGLDDVFADYVENDELDLLIMSLNAVISMFDDEGYSTIILDGVALENYEFLKHLHTEYGIRVLYFNTHIETAIHRLKQVIHTELDLDYIKTTYKESEKLVEKLKHFGVPIINIRT